MAKGLHRKPGSRSESAFLPEFGSSIPPALAAKEREKARELRKSPWWKQQLAKGICHYCGKQFPPDELTMDHVIPVARGGKSERSNVVPACKSCNNEKKALTPAEQILNSLNLP